MGDKHIEQKLKRFFSQYSLIKFKSGEIVIRSTASIDAICYIIDGRIKQSYTSDAGNDLTLHFFEPGSYIPMMLLIGEMENKYNFTATMETTVYRAPADEVLEFIKNNPELLFHFTQKISIGLSKMLLKVENLIFENANNRVSSLIKYLVNKFGVSKDGYTLIDIKITHSDIGSWVGLARETVSRQIEMLIERDIIGYEGRKIIVKDLNRL